MGIIYRIEPQIEQVGVAPDRGIFRFLREIVKIALMKAVHWQEISRQRRQLRNLEPWMLRDVGLTKIDVDRECSKLPWQM